MHKLQELKERLCNELSEYGERSKLDAQTLDIVDKLAHTVKNLDKIISESGYSGARYRRDDMGRFVGDYQNGYSMNRDGYYSGDSMHDGYSMNYSRDMKNIKDELRDIMNSADGHTKQSLQRIISQM